MIRPRPAPRAERTAISRSLPTACVSRRFATFAQAISSRNSTARLEIEVPTLNPSLKTSSCRVRILAPFPEFVSGYSSASWAAMRSVSSAACACVNPSFTRASTLM